MARCTNCGKSGLFLKLENGLCKNCTKIAPKHELAKSSLLPISKPRNISVELLPLEQPFNKTPFLNHFDFMVCTLVNSRIRVDSRSGVPLGYLPADMADLCLSGHVKSVFFNGRDCSAVNSSSVTGSIEVDIFLVPSGGMVPKPEKDPLERASGYSWIYPKIIDDQSIAYWYPSLAISNVDRDILRKMVIAENHQPQIEIAPNETTVLTYDGTTVAILQEKQDMCRDWLRKDLPLVCQFSSFKENSEKVALAFYRDDRKKYLDCKSALVKLTAYKNEDAQLTISGMKSPEKLKVDEFEGLVLDIYNNEIGKLPSKYRHLCEEGAVDAIYFDHFDVLENDDFEDIYVPYVKIYFD